MIGIFFHGLSALSGVLNFSQLLHVNSYVATKDWTKLNQQNNNEMTAMFNTYGGHPSCTEEGIALKKKTVKFSLKIAANTFPTSLTNYRILCLDIHGRKL